MEEYDVIVLGCGAGGYEASVAASSLGAQVCVVEKGRIGGAHVHSRCVPFRVFSEVGVSYLRLKELHDQRIVGEEPTINLLTAIRRRNESICEIERLATAGLEKWGVVSLQGEGELVGTHEVEVSTTNGQGTRCLRGESIVVATGSSFSSTYVTGTGETIPVLTPDELLSMEELPRSILIIGGGIVGCECACLLRMLGVKVTVVEVEFDHLLPSEQPAISSALYQLMQNSGIRFHFADPVERIRNCASSDVETVLLSGRRVVSAAVLATTAARPAQSIRPSFGTVNT